MAFSEADLLKLQVNQRRALLGDAGSLPVDKSPRKPRPRQNKWEEAYDAELRMRYGAGIIQWYGFEAIKLRLADSTYYTPDFAVLDESGLSFIEVKGFIRDDAIVKFKIAAEQFPFKFQMIRKQKVSEGGGWLTIREIAGGKRTI